MPVGRFPRGLSTSSRTSLHLAVQILIHQTVSDQEEQLSGVKFSQGSNVSVQYPKAGSSGPLVPIAGNVKIFICYSTSG